MKKYIILFVLCFMSVKSALAYCVFSCEDGSSPSAQTSNTAPGNACTLPPEYSGYGLVFGGWTDGTNVYQSGDTIAGGCSVLSTNKEFWALWVVPSVLPVAVASKSYVDFNVADKQDKLSGTSGYAVIYGAASGQTDSRQIVTTLGTSNSSNTLPTTGAVVTGLNTKQNTIPAANNRVITYTGTSGSLSSIGIYSDTGTYSGQTGTLAQVQHVNSAIANGFDAHIVCDEYDIPGDSTSECILWRINQLSGTYVPEN